MASIRKHPKSPFWFACITLPDGRQTQRSTKLTDAKKALKKARCAVGKVRKKRSSGKPNRVLSQKPKPGKHLPAGSKVSLVVSKR